MIVSENRAFEMLKDHMSLVKQIDDLFFVKKLNPTNFNKQLKLEKTFQELFRSVENVLVHDLTRFYFVNNQVMQKLYFKCINK
jgi:hypothetical protein